MELAAVAGPNDPRLAFSYYVLGRQSLGSDPGAALNAFTIAGRIYQSRPDTGLQQAHVALQIAAFNPIEICQAQNSDACSRQVKSNR